MQILDFPPEILHRILYWACISRGITRALRLKLVCRTFYTQLNTALFETRLLDNASEVIDMSRRTDYSFMLLWYASENNGAAKTMHSYLAYRVRGMPKPEEKDLFALRAVVDAFCHETGAELGTVIDSLCWAALELVGNWLGSDYLFGVSDEDINVELFSAAAYMNHLPLVHKLLREGYCPTKVGYLFKSPIQLAAWAGHAELVELFQEHLPDFEDLEEYDGRKVPDWRGKMGPGAIEGAAARGDMEMVRLVFRPVSHDFPDIRLLTDDFSNVCTRKAYGILVCLMKGMEGTASLDVFKYFTSLFDERGRKQIYEDSVNLHQHAAKGHVDIVRHILEQQGWQGDLAHRHNRTPLYAAAGRCQENVVDLVLDWGVDFGSQNQRNWPAVEAAAGAGSLVIVRKLLKHGAEINRLSRALELAIRREHTAMVEMLLEMGAGEKNQESVLEL